MMINTFAQPMIPGVIWVKDHYVFQNCIYGLPLSQAVSLDPVDNK